MNLHFFDTAVLEATPWKNGGGSTREIVCQPPGAGMADFDWRVSIATIATPGPFSVFPGIDRVILLLAGAGVRLRADGIDHRLDTPLEPFAFAGDVAVDCDLLGGPFAASSDFNVMTRRGKFSAEVETLREAGAVAPCAAGLVLAVGGAWHLQAAGVPHRLEADRGAWWRARVMGLHATPLDPGAALVIVRIDEENGS